MTDVFCDIETTGLRRDRHQIVEIAWAVEDGPVHVVHPRHTLDFAEPQALKVNRYRKRGLGQQFSTANEVSLFLLAVRGNTLVAANPAFDAGFLEVHFGWAPWHYRMRDIQSFADGVLGFWSRPPSLVQICTTLRELGHDIPDPDHSAVADVRALRAAWRALRVEQGRSLQLREDLAQPAAAPVE